MREKSSSVLTSFSSRRPLRCTSSRSLALGDDRRRRRMAHQHVLERPEHQRQRRAELVAHVGEERGLGAVELGERLGPAALLFVGAGVGDRRGDLPRDQIEKPSIGDV